MKLPRTLSRMSFFCYKETDIKRPCNFLFVSFVQTPRTRRLVVEECHYRGLVRRDGWRGEYYQQVRWGASGRHKRYLVLSVTPLVLRED